MAHPVPLPPVSLSILTWKAPRTLERTLRSMRPIMRLFQERLVVCQESDPEEMDLVRRYGFTPVGTDRNLGIQGGIEKAIACASNSAVLFAENDCPFTASGTEVLERALREFEAHRLDVMRLQLVEKSKKYRRYWRDGADGIPCRRLLGALRWTEATACLAESVSEWNGHTPDTAFRKKAGANLWITGSQYIRWSNRPFLVRRSLFLETLMPFANAYAGRKKVNGFSDLEVPLNSPETRWWWRQQAIQIGLLNQELFGHVRFDRPDGDEKWITGDKVEDPAGLQGELG